MTKFSNNKKWTSWLLAIMMLVYIAAPGLPVAVKADEAVKEFDLVSITDFHGALEKTKSNPGAATLGKVVMDVKEKNPDRTLVIGGGDFYQGTPTSNVLFGKPVADFMSYLGMEVTALGNHEFDWGLEKINDYTMQGESFEIVCANMYNKGTNERPYKPYKVITKDGVKIAVIGAISEETPGIAFEKFVGKFDFRDAATEVNKAAKEAREKDKADVVLLTIHEGERNDPNQLPLTHIVEKLKGVDAIFGGHSHWRHDKAVVDAEGIERPVVIAGSNGQGFIDLKMKVTADKKISFSEKGKNYVNATKLTEEDANAKKIVDDAIAKVGPIFKEKIGTAVANMGRVQVGGKYGESELGAWTAEAIRRAGNADVGVQNNGGIRCDISKGDITVGTIFSLMPFDNELVTIEVTGAQLKTLFEQAIVDNGKGIQIAGAKFEYDSTKPEMNRVVKVTREDGTPIQNDEKIKMATSDFLSTGTVEGYSVLADANVQASKKTDHKLLRDVFMDRVKETKTMRTIPNNRILDVTQKKPLNSKVDVQMLTTTDMHNRMVGWDYATDSANTKGSFAQVVTEVKELRAKNPNTVLVDAGDVVQDNSAALFLDKAKYPVHPMIEGMNLLGYDAWTLGNHEFNYGMDKVKDFINSAEATVLCANVYDKDGKTRIAAPYKVVEKDGVKIGIIGITTPNITKWDAVNLKDYKVNGAIEEVRAAIEKLRGNVDIMVGVFHMGEQNEYDIPETGVIDVATKCPELSLIVAGHMHITIAPHYVYNGKAYSKDDKGKVTALDNTITGSAATEEQYNEAVQKGVMIVESGKFAENLGKIDLSFELKDGKYALASRNVSLVNLSNVKEDEEMVELFKPYDEIAKADAKTVIGELKGGDLVPVDEVKGIPESQVRPTAMIDLINKVQMYYGEKISGRKIDVAAAAAFRGDANIKEGKITKAGTSLIYKYDNTLYVLELTGKQLKQYMEWSASYYNQYKDGDLTVSFNAKIPGYNYDMFTGVKYQIDISKEPGNRVLNLTKMDGTPITDDMKLTLAVNDYRGKSQLMGNKSIFGAAEGATLIAKSEDSMGDAGRVRDLIREYIITVKGGVITPECDNNWSIIGNNWDSAKRAVLIEMVNDGKLAVKASEDGKTSNGASLTWDDVLAAGGSLKEDEKEDKKEEIDKENNTTEAVTVEGTSEEGTSTPKELAKTGSLVDMTALVSLGLVLIGMGAFIGLKKQSKAQ